MNAMHTPLTKPTTTPQVFGGCGLGGVGLEGVGVLVGLGLSGRQARVYLATLKLGGGRVQSIAGLSGVSRQEIYRLMEGLQGRGFVQKNLTNPTTYTATPLGQISKMLLKQKTTELSVLSRQVGLLTQKFAEGSCLGVQGVGLVPCFGTIFEADRGKKYCDALKSVQGCFEGVFSWRRFKQVNIHYQELLQGALEKGVAMRLVTEKPVNYHLPKWILSACADYPNFKLKILQRSPLVAVSVFDQNLADIAFDPNSSLTKGLDLWTATPSLLALCREYVNVIWAQAKTYRH